MSDYKGLLNSKDGYVEIDKNMECQIENLAQLMPEYIASLNKVIIKLNEGPNWLEIGAQIILSALAGALAAYLFTVYHTKSNREAENFSSVIDGLKENLKELETNAVAYWLESSTKPKSSKEIGLELKIKGLLAVIRRMSKVAQKPLKKRGLVNLADALEIFHDEMFDKITGGDFESTSREKSEEIASNISSECSNMIARISSLKHWV